MTAKHGPMGLTAEGLHVDPILVPRGGTPDLGYVMSRRGFPRRFAGKALSSWKVTPGTPSERARAVCEALVRDWSSRTEFDPQGPNEGLGRGVALIGPYGTGTTALACATAYEIARLRKPIRFISAHNFVAALAKQRLIEDLANKGDERALDLFWKIDDLIHSVNNVDLLVFDNLGEEHQTSSDMAISEIFRLITNRYNRGKPTIVTSAFPIESWSSIYTPALSAIAVDAFDEVFLG